MLGSAMRRSTEGPIMRRFQQVDVFAPEPLRGNPVAVVLDGEGLTTEQMQRFTRWTNLSEATFLLPPRDADADYRVRIFTAAGELPFAGHPTLGSCHAWLASGGRPRAEGRIVQECGAGLVRLRRIDGRLAFMAPPLRRSGPVDEADLARACGVLGIRREDVVDSQWADNGPGWLALRLRSAEAVLAVTAARPPGDLGRVDLGLVGPYPPGAPCAYEVRAIFSDDRGALLEDPVTGSLNAALAQWLAGTGRFSPPYVASQGTLLGRSGRVHISQDADGAIWVGGATHTLIEGQLLLDVSDGRPEEADRAASG
jgi:PhzF family phenazine biosynthesis protein